ncbi:MAG TPA: alpha-hydroxy acid oxidase [Steroidobacteraceae bacterium]|nr:alpha-hydroxy acid oxidase [Steroidobacteraceae bacterium]
MRVVNSIGDLRALAQRRIPRAVFDYADRGSFDELTIVRNRSDLDALQFRQRVMRDLSHIQLATTMLGEPVTIPLGIAPVGSCGLFYGNGEIHGARAAQAFGVPFCLSTMSVCSIEDVRAEVARPFWFQIYLMRDRAFNEQLVSRAIAAGCTALMLTVDLPILATRRRDAKNGMSTPPRLTLHNALDILSKPGWMTRVLFGKRRTYGNLLALGRGGNVKTLAQWIEAQFDPGITWKEIEWLRRIWPGKLIVKGILDAEDAGIAAGLDIDALVVSNHGGRQLDGAPSTIAVLPEVVAAVGNRCEVWFDGGVQSGQDILKALALGANACLIGKSFLYALGALGGPGVTLALEILRKELQVSMALTGCTDVNEVDRSVLRSGGP